MSGQEILSDLHFEKQRAIDALDFEKAHVLYDEIQNTIAIQARHSVSNIHHTSQRALKKTQSDFRRLLEHLVEEKRKLDARLYSQFHVLFEQTRADHINQIIDLEKERGLTLLSESEREVEEQISLLEQAKQAAIDSYFDRAIELRSEARRVGQIELERRRHSVEQYFANAKIELLRQQQLELDEIGAMHQVRLDSERADAQQKDIEAVTEFRLAVRHLLDETLVQIRALRATEELKDSSVADALAELEALMAQFLLLPPVVAHLTHSDEMKVMALCPTNAVKNAMPRDIPPALLQKAAVAKAKPKTARAAARPVWAPSTRLMTRAYTGVCRPGVHSQSSRPSA
jgi:hypothetical protein